MPSSPDPTLRAIEIIGASLCGYTVPGMSPPWLEVRCDCKYGVSVLPTMGEATGCPELRDAHAAISALRSADAVERIARKMNFEAGRQRGLTEVDDWIEITEFERASWIRMAQVAFAELGVK